MTAPTVNDYLDKARGNRAHAEWVFSMLPNNQIGLQWVVTAAFYSALHGVSAYLLGIGVQVTNHTARAKALGDPANGVPPAILVAYRTLEFQSRQARYMHSVFRTQDVRDLLDQELARIAAFTGM
jgi:hypothetical protein